MGKLIQIPHLKHYLDGKRAELMTPYEYRLDSGKRLYVPKGFVTDGASIPKPFWSIIGGPWGAYLYAAIPHDYGYYVQDYERATIDHEFLLVMNDLNVSFWKPPVMYRAVRDWGWIPWNRYSKK